MPRSTRINIDLGAILHNAGVLRAAAGDKHIMAVVKADAYGHGAVPVATHIEGTVDAFAVALIEEAVTLRDAGVTKPILVLEGPHCSADLALCVHLNIWPTLHRADQLDWCHALTEKPEQVWLKIDTGMHRLGFQPVQAQSITQSLKADGIKTVVAMSHLAAAETPDSELSVTQKTTWDTATNHWEDETSLHNSAATWLATPARSAWARIGYALYGGQIEGLEPDPRLKPAMTLVSSVLATRRITQGDSVGYGGRWTAGRDSIIATVPVGYGDGYPWAAADGTPVAIGEHLAPLAGRVSMDMITVDVTDFGEIACDMPVTLWGTQPHIDTVARHAGTIGYELMTRLTQRAPRHYLR